VNGVNYAVSSHAPPPSRGRCIPPKSKYPPQQSVVTHSQSMKISVVWLVTLAIRFFLSIKYQMLCPYKTTNEIMSLYIGNIIVKCLDIRETDRQTKDSEGKSVQSVQVKSLTIWRNKIWAGIGTRYGLDGLVWFPERKDYYVRLWAPPPPAIYPMSTGGSFPGVRLPGTEADNWPKT
jgi:hypothetical protein